MEWEELEDRWFETDFDDIDDETSFAFWQTAGNIAENEMTSARRSQPPLSEAPKKRLFRRLVDGFRSIPYRKGTNV
jgi:hypothetical protein